MATSWSFLERGEDESPWCRRAVQPEYNLPHFSQAYQVLLPLSSSTLFIHSFARRSFEKGCAEGALRQLGNGPFGAVVLRPVCRRGHVARADLLRLREPGLFAEEVGRPARAAVPLGFGAADRVSASAAQLGLPRALFAIGAGLRVLV